jgi:hypothetical protein
MLHSHKDDELPIMDQSKAKGISARPQAEDPTKQGT